AGRGRATLRRGWVNPRVREGKIRRTLGSHVSLGKTPGTASLPSSEVRRVIFHKADGGRIN
ncbi:MAG TPA: hypothetical protein PKI05_14195, partial [Thermogutta sp.]|nr:hypothetical protein [Thermogutta sp.]